MHYMIAASRKMSDEPKNIRHCYEKISYLCRTLGINQYYC